MSECTSGTSSCSAIRSIRLLGGGLAHATAEVDERALGLHQLGRDGVGSLGREVGTRVGHRQRVGCRRARKRRGRENMSIGTLSSVTPGRPGARGPVRALEESGQVLDPGHVPGPLDEGSVDRRLVGVRVEVDLLVRVPAAVVRRDVAADDDEGDGVESCGRGAGDRVHHAGTDVHDDHARATGRARVAVGRVRRGLLVPEDDEVDAAAAERVEERDVGVAAQRRRRG